MFKFTKKAFIAVLSFSGSLARVTKVSNHKKRISVNNELCLTRPTLFDLNSVELHYCPYMVSSDRCDGSCNTFDDLSSRIFVPNKTEDENLNVVNMIIRVNVSKALTEHNSCDCKCELDGRKCNSDQKWSKDLCLNECTNSTKHHVCKKKIYV